MTGDKSDKGASKKKSCFVVCPIGEDGSATRRHADWLLHEIIEHVLDHHFKDQFTVFRSYKIDQPGMIDAQIIGHLLDDDLVIADMSELNPNAFYEMGIRHMKELPIIHMFKKGTVIPFDVKLYRAIPFDYADPADLKVARSNLNASISAVIDSAYKADNPVIRARGVVQIPETSTPEYLLIQQQLDNLSQKMSRIENFGSNRLDSNISDFRFGSISLQFDKRYGSKERENATLITRSISEKMFPNSSFSTDGSVITVTFAEPVFQSSADHFAELAGGLSVFKRITTPANESLLS